MQECEGYQCQLFVECDEELMTRIGEQFGDLAERHIRLADNCSFVALEGGKVVGFISVTGKLYHPH